MGFKIYCFNIFVGFQKLFFFVCFCFLFVCFFVVFFVCFFFFLGGGGYENIVDIFVVITQLDWFMGHCYVFYDLFLMSIYRIGVLWVC